MEREEAVFMRLNELIGRDMAFYCMCAVYNKPYIADNDADTWAEYKAEIENGEFSDGETDVHVAQLSGMSQIDRWKEYWGLGEEGNPYSDDDYRALDENERNILDQFDSVGGIARAIQKKTAKDCAIIDLKVSKLIAKGDKDSVDMAVKLRKMSSDALADCNMRAKDILPTQTIRIDTLLEAMRKKWGYGLEITEAQAVEVFRKYNVAQKYIETPDAAALVMKLILNTMMRNDDMPEITEFSEDYSPAQFESEFADEPTEAEREAFDYLGEIPGTAVERREK